MTTALRIRLGLIPAEQPEPAADVDERADRFHTYGVTR